MEVMEAIKGRRTVRDFKPDPIPEAVMDEIYEAAVWAPSHRNAQPWEFIEVGPEARAQLLGMLQQKLDELLASGQVPPPARAGFESLKQDFGGAPELVAVVSRPPEMDIDGFEFPLAAAMAVQNMSLAGWAHGVGMVWLTLGSAPPARGVLGIAEGYTGVALLAMGYPQQTPPPPPREPADKRIRSVG